MTADDISYAGDTVLAGQLEAAGITLGEVSITTKRCQRPSSRIYQSHRQIFTLASALVVMLSKQQGS